MGSRPITVFELCNCGEIGSHPCLRNMWERSRVCSNQTSCTKFVCRQTGLIPSPAEPRETNELWQAITARKVQHAKALSKSNFNYTCSTIRIIHNRRYGRIRPKKRGYICRRRYEREVGFTEGWSSG